MNYKATDIDGSWATIELKRTIEVFNTQSSRQTQQMLFLAKVIAGLTFVMLIGLAAQIYFLFRPPVPNPTIATQPPAASPLPVGTKSSSAQTSPEAAPSSGSPAKP